MGRREKRSPLGCGNSTRGRAGQTCYADKQIIARISQDYKGQRPFEEEL